MKMNSAITKLVWLFLIATSCKNPTITIDGFKSDDWKQDSLACFGKRKELFSVLLKNKEKIIGHSKKDVIEYLGKPNLGDDLSLLYFVHGGIQCDSLNKSNKDSIQVKSFEILLSKHGTVVDVDLIVP